MPGAHLRGVPRPGRVDRGGTRRVRRPADGGVFSTVDAARSRRSALGPKPCSARRSASAAASTASQVVRPAFVRARRAGAPMERTSCGGTSRPASCGIPAVSSPSSRSSSTRSWPPSSSRSTSWRRSSWRLPSSSPAAGASPRGGLGLLDRAGQGCEQVDDLAGLLRLGGGDPHLAALDLGAHELLDGDGVVVLVLARLVVSRELVDEHLGHVHLLLGGLLVLGDAREVGRADLVGPQHRLHDDDPVADPQHGHRHPGADGDGADRHPLLLDEGVAEQDVGLGRGLVGLEVVALVEPHRVDLVGRHELRDADLLRGPARQVGEVLVGEHDHVAVLGLVALGDVVVRHLLAVDGAGALVLDPPAVLAVDLAELHVVVLGRRVEPDRHVDQAEGDGALPDRSHRCPPSVCRAPPRAGRRLPA